MTPSELRQAVELNAVRVRHRMMVEVPFSLLEDAGVPRGAFYEEMTKHAGWNGGVSHPRDYYVFHRPAEAPPTEEERKMRWIDQAPNIASEILNLEDEEGNAGVCLEPFVMRCPVCGEAQGVGEFHVHMKEPTTKPAGEPDTYTEAEAAWRRTIEAGIKAWAEGPKRRDAIEPRGAKGFLDALMELPLTGECLDRIRREWPAMDVGELRAAVRAFLNLRDRQEERALEAIERGQDAWVNGWNARCKMHEPATKPVEPLRYEDREGEHVVSIEQLERWAAGDFAGLPTGTVGMLAMLQALAKRVVGES